MTSRDSLRLTMTSSDSNFAAEAVVVLILVRRGLAMRALREEVGLARSGWEALHEEAGLADLGCREALPYSTAPQHQLR